MNSWVRAARPLRKTQHVKKKNIVLEKSFLFAASILDLNERVVEKRQFELASQLVRSGTSIGANVRESQRAVSTADFINKLGIALKEADETDYWLRLVDLKVTRVDEQMFNELEALMKLLVSIINSTKRNNRNNG